VSLSDLPAMGEFRIRIRIARGSGLPLIYHGASASKNPKPNEIASFVIPAVLGA
jgi:hypothetical protein